MLRKLNIQNFRAFSQLAVTGLERINLIAGKNNSGKTALLEAIHVLSYPANCTMPGLVNQQRRVNLRDSLASGKWLYFNSDNSHPISLEVSETSGRNRTLAIELIDGAASYSYAKHVEIAKLFPPDFPKEWLFSGNAKFFSNYSDNEGNKGHGIVVYNGIQTNSVSTKMPAVSPSIFVTAKDKNEPGLNVAADDQNELFSEMAAAGRLDEILTVLRHFEPRLRSLDLLTFSGETLIHGKIGHQRPIPLALMGEGFQRLLFVALIIAVRKGGIVLIDEIENGLHYSVLPTIWKAIGKAARLSDVQVFATTHSWECIRAAHEAFSEGEPYDFRLIRLDRENGAISAVSYDHDMIETALLTGLEMR